MTTRILIGDCRQVLPTLEEGRFHTVVTSPPYFGLRDYGHDDQIGLEATPEDFVEAMVDVFRHVRRVLRDDGTVWLNIGDSYARSPAKGGSGPGGKNEPRWGYGDAQSTRGAPSHGLADKQLLGIPWRVAFALQADGWFLRQDVIWAKNNPMPEPAKDRCVRAHEYLFLLSKRPRYYFDFEAIQEPETCGRVRGGALHGDQVSTNGNGGLARRKGNGMRNRRSVWPITSEPFGGAHFAPFPPALVEPCILAGSPAGGEVLDPFGGAGTTGMVADRLGRNATLVELNPEYAEIMRRRLEGDGGMFSSVEVGA